MVLFILIHKFYLLSLIFFYQLFSFAYLVIIFIFFFFCNT